MKGAAEALVSGGNLQSLFEQLYVLELWDLLLVHLLTPLCIHSLYVLEVKGNVELEWFRLRVDLTNFGDFWMPPGEQLRKVCCI